MSTRQVTKRPTRLAGSAIEAPEQWKSSRDIGGKGVFLQAAARPMNILVVFRA
jgi:hypothetical protein